ncbi:hypothetical protein D3C71_1933270 [compost metagenome]
MNDMDLVDHLLLVLRVRKTHQFVTVAFPINETVSGDTILTDDPAITFERHVLSCLVLAPTPRTSCS